MSNGGVCRTALATPGILLNELITTVFLEHPLALPDLLTRWGSPVDRRPFPMQLLQYEKSTCPAKLLKIFEPIMKLEFFFEFRMS